MTCNLQVQQLDCTNNTQQEAIPAYTIQHIQYHKMIHNFTGLHWHKTWN